MARIWKISIPVRPKAVQSVRMAGRGFYVDPAVRKWKDSIRPYIKAACYGEAPTELPLRINKIRYLFKYPQSAPKNVRDYIDAGGVVPYIGTTDITDNLAKGLVDTCAGLVFANDKLIWRTAEAEKVYAKEDGIYIEFEETPDVFLIDGKPASGEMPEGLF